MAKTEESRLEEIVEKFMQEHHIWQLARYQAQSNRNGLPDRLYLYKGFLIGLELKTDKGKPTDLQIKKIKEINENGGIGLLVGPVEISNLKHLIGVIDWYRIGNVALLSEKIRLDFKEICERCEDSDRQDNV